MAQHKTITIKIAYDDAHPIPSDKDLERGVDVAVSLGMLNDAEEQCVIETWDVSITDGDES